MLQRYTTAACFDSPVGNVRRIEMAGDFKLNDDGPVIDGAQLVANCMNPFENLQAMSLYLCDCCRESIR